MASLHISTRSSKGNRLVFRACLNAGTMRSSSMGFVCCVVTANKTWPKWIGENEPPKMPRRSGGSGSSSWPSILETDLWCRCRKFSSNLSACSCESSESSQLWRARKLDMLQNMLQCMLMQLCSSHAKEVPVLSAVVCLWRVWCCFLFGLTASFYFGKQSEKSRE